MGPGRGDQTGLMRTRSHPKAIVLTPKLEFVLVPAPQECKGKDMPVGTIQLVDLREHTATSPYRGLRLLARILKRRLKSECPQLLRLHAGGKRCGQRDLPHRADQRTLPKMGVLQDLDLFSRKTLREMGVQASHLLARRTLQKKHIRGSHQPQRRMPRGLDAQFSDLLAMTAIAELPRTVAGDHLQLQLLECRRSQHERLLSRCWVFLPLLILLRAN